MGKRPASKHLNDKARHVDLATRACLTGLPCLEKEGTLSPREAAAEFKLTSKTAIHRMLSEQRYAAFRNAVREAEFPDDLQSWETTVLCRALFCFGPQAGGQTLLTPAEEAKLVHHINALGERGYSVDRQILKQWALAIALANHPDSKITKSWTDNGVSSKWYNGFMSRWRDLISQRWGEGLEGARRNVTFDQISGYFDILEELAEEIGVRVGADGKRKFADFQMMNLDEMCLMNSPKLSPMICTKGQAKALRAENKNYRDSVTVLLTIRADGDPCIAPLVIVQGAESNEEGELRQPRWWGTKECVNAVKGANAASCTVQKAAAVASWCLHAAPQCRLSPYAMPMLVLVKQC